MKKPPAPAQKHLASPKKPLAPAGAQPPSGGATRAGAPEPRFFASAVEFRAWLSEHHEKATELLVGLHKKASGTASLTYKEAVDEGLCFGWIDGVRRTIDADRWTIRFTPRKPRSIWSKINLARAAELSAEGRMAPAGLRAYEGRNLTRQNLYSFEQEEIRAFTAAEEEAFRANAEAWAFYEAQPAGYRKVSRFWVVSAKKEETVVKRLAQLISDSSRGLRIAHLVPPAVKRAQGR